MKYMIRTFIFGIIFVGLSLVGSPAHAKDPHIDPPLGIGHHCRVLDVDTFVVNNTIVTQYKARCQSRIVYWHHVEYL